MNNRCVYVHKDLDGNVFYVGSGSIQRARALELSSNKGKGTCRGKKYSEKVKSLDFKYCCEILHYDLTVDEALELEKSTMISYMRSGMPIVNIKLPTKGVTLDFNYFNDNYYVSDESKTGLLSKNGNPAGVFENSSGTYVLYLFEDSYYVHRIIMLLQGYVLSPAVVVEHINGDRSDNSSNNLRVVSRRENLENMYALKYPDKIIGVNFIENRNAYTVNWYNNGIRKTKYFYLRNYNFNKEETLKHAIAHRKEMVEQNKTPVERILLLV